MIYKLIPATVDYLWGGVRLKEQFAKVADSEIIAETWELSTHKDGQSTVEKTGEKLSEHVAKHKGCLGVNCEAFEDFPVLIKLIDAADKLSIQVHPDDEYALKNEGQYGKTEMWYVVDAAPGAYIYYGFKQMVTKEEFLSSVSDNTICDKLNKIDVKKGDVFFIEAGTIHAIGEGCLIAEVQQNSNVTYRVYDFDRRDANGNLRELHVQKAAEVTDLTQLKLQENSAGHLAKCKYFTVDLIDLAAAQNFKSVQVDKGSFCHFLLIEGTAEFKCKEGEVSAVKGDSIFAHANTGEVTLSGDAKIVMTYIEKEEYRIGIDLGGTNIKAGVLDSKNNILATHSVKTGADRRWREIAKDIADTAREALKKAGVSLDDCIGVGIGSPGTMDAKTGVVIYSNNFSDWTNIPLGDTIKEELGKSVAISNDANCAALGEFVAGAAKEYSSTVLITLGTGVGTGFVMDGHLFEGGSAGGAEAGHMIIVKDGEHCTCGRNGCFEAYASATALVRDAIKAAKANPNSLLAKMYEENGNAMNGIIPFKAAKANDETGLAVVNNYMQNLGEGIVNLINIFRPQIVLISGGICGEREYLTDPLNKFVENNAYAGDKVIIPRVEIATLGNNAGIVGAANLVGR